MIDFKTTDIYKEIISCKENKLYTIPYYKDTKMLITEDNYLYILDIEEIRLKKQLNILSDTYNNIFDYNILLESIKKDLISKIGTNRLTIETIIVDKNNIDKIINDIETDHLFHSWC